MVAEEAIFGEVTSEQTPERRESAGPWGSEKSIQGRSLTCLRKNKEPSMISS
jgi:hypothetical protein